MLVACASVMWLLSCSVAAQDVSSPVDSGVRIPIERQVQAPQVSAPLVVVGHRPEHDIPQPYAPYAYRDSATFMRDSSGSEIRYIYIRPVWDVSTNTKIEYYSTWRGQGLSGSSDAPTHSGRTGRLVCRPNNVFLIFVDPFKVLGECVE